jgi:glycosyltransferase involved in cell wall biosynthesis
MVVPLRIGGGSRLKILEALAMETPVISTRIGAEGLHLTPGEHLTVSEGIGDMAGMIRASLRDPAGMRDQAERGRMLVRDRHDWDILADRLEAIWLDCAAGVNGNHSTRSEPVDGEISWMGYNG